MADLSAHPQLVALLDAARRDPHDNAPRMVLADWLDEHGDADRAAFIRLQLMLAPGASPLEPPERQRQQERCRRLLLRHGGAWLGPLWRWPPWRTEWHRGLLTGQLRGRYVTEDLEGVLPWVDTLLFHVTGLDSLRRSVDLLGHAGFNHVTLDLRNALREEAVLDGLTRLPPLPCLRTVSFGWPMRMLRRSGVDAQGRRRCTPAASTAFLRRLLALPSARRLTHLASSWPFDEGQAALIRGFGVEPVHASHALWMHDLRPSCFRVCR